MDINASIVHQRISGILEGHDELLPAGVDVNKKKSAAFVLLCMSTSLAVSLEEAAEMLTDGGQDAGVDGIHLGDIEDGDFTITLFQGKYKVNNLDGEGNFPENDVKKAIQSVTTLFDPKKDVNLNPRLAPRIEEIRSLVLDGYIPVVRMVLCNNGKRWTDDAQRLIDQSGLATDQTSWIHFNHDSIVGHLKSTKAVDHALSFKGQAVIEEFNFRRVLIGRVPVTEIADLFDRHGDLLLQRNIRRYLGLGANRVNAQIQATLADPDDRQNFYFYNNGITVICNKFRHNALQGADYQVKLENMQVINGGQTCKTIQRTLGDPKLFEKFDNAFVMVRIYELADDDQDFVRDITFATNSQNPVDLRDLRSNDALQKQLEIGLKDLGFTYRRQRAEGSAGPTTVTSATVAESVLAIWRQRPHQAKFRAREHFGKLYSTIFEGLNAAQALIATLTFRSVENRRKRPVDELQPDFLPYASHYLAMLVGEMLLEDMDIEISDLSHRNANQARETLHREFPRFHSAAIERVEEALGQLYRDRGVSLQRLSATFRRGDLLKTLDAQD